MRVIASSESSVETPENKYMPYTNNLFLRKEKGIQFMLITVLIIGYILQYFLAYFRDCIQNDKIPAAVIVTFIGFVLLILAYWSLVKTIFTDPGSVDPDYIHPLKDEEEYEQNNDEGWPRGRPRFNPSMQEKYENIISIFTYNSINYSIIKVGGEIKVKQNFDLNQSEDTNSEELNSMHKFIIVENFRLRKCKICKKNKPPRTHHCRRCNHCVLKMDHHCVFLGCCIGFNNHKHFVLFTFYVSVEIAFLLIVYLHAITAFNFGSDSVVKLVLGYIVPILVLVPVLVFTFFLFVTHFVFDLMNVTKLEYNFSFKCRPFDTKHSFLNFKESFGDPKFKGLWLLPVDPGSCSKIKQDCNFNPLGPRTGIKKKDGHQFFLRVLN